MGLKALASKLHPQLPLSPKESHRLLNALTTSFRDHLDKAHPRTAGGEIPSPSRIPALAPSTDHQRNMHSSAAYADQHLSNVLTMFGHGSQAPPKEDLVTKAKRELAAGADPLALLEEYEEKGLASVGIATECLIALKSTIDTLDYEQQAEIVKQNRAGSRALGWLWESGPLLIPNVIENKRFTFLLARFVMLEGREEFLWDWLQLDMGETATEDGRGQLPAQKYRWKSKVFGAMVRAAIARPQPQPGCLDNAICVFLKAADLESSACVHNGSFRHVQGGLILQEFTAMLAVPGRYFGRTDPELMNRMLQHVRESNLYKPRRE